MQLESRFTLLLIALGPSIVLAAGLLLFAGQIEPAPRVWLTLFVAGSLIVQLMLLPVLVVRYRELEAQSWGQIAAWAKGLVEGSRLPIPQAPKVAQVQLLRLEESFMAQSDRLGTLAIIDPRTGALSRQGLSRRLQSELERAQRFDRGLAVLVVAHAQEGFPLANALAKYARAVDLTAQVSATAAAVLLPETSTTGASEMASRLHNDLSSKTDHGLGIGIASFPGTARNADQLLKRAETAALSGLHSPESPIVRAESVASDPSVESINH